MSLNGEVMEEVDHFKYLGSQTGRQGGMKVDVSFRVEEARRAAGNLRSGGKMGVWEWKIRCYMRE